jgi:hypothetical protein
MIEHKLTFFDETNGEISLSNFQGLSINREMNDMISTMSFSLASGTELDVILKKYLYVEYYIKSDEKSAIFRCKFRGFVDTILQRSSKDSRTYSITCLDKLSIFSRIEFFKKIDIASVRELLRQLQLTTVDALQRFLINEYLPFTTINFESRINGLNVIIRDLSPSNNLITYLRNIREKTPVYVYYNPETDTVVFTNPTYLQYDYRTNAVLPIYDFDTETNILGTLDYGDISNDVNAVIYIGFNGVQGAAIDFINAGIQGTVRPLYKYNFSTGNKEDLEELARNDLLDISKNFHISFNTSFTETNLDIDLGEMIAINDHQNFYGDRYFIIRKIDYTVQKGDVIISLECSASVLTDIPEDFVLNKFGVTDIDTLTVNEDKPKGDLE